MKRKPAPSAGFFTLFQSPKELVLRITGGSQPLSCLLSKWLLDFSHAMLRQN
jgi:hypothetical protein